MAWHGMERERERDCDKQYTIPDFNVYQIKMNTMSFQAKWQLANLNERTHKHTHFDTWKTNVQVFG